MFQLLRRIVSVAVVALVVIIDESHNIEAACPMTYTTSPEVPTTLYSINVHLLSISQSITIQSLSGSIAKAASPVVYFTGDSQYDMWLRDISEQTDIGVNDTFVDDPDSLIDFLFTTYAASSSSVITSMITYTNIDDADSVSQAVTFAAGSTGAVIVLEGEADEYTVKYNIPVVYDTRDPLPVDLSFSDNSIVFQQADAQPFLLDYAVFSSSPYLTWSDPARDDHLARLRDSSTTCAAAYGWVSDEGSYVSHLAEYGVFVHASDWAQDMVPLSNIQVAIPPLPAAAHDSSNVEDDSSVHTVTFVMTDGDNLQWLLGGFMQESWFGAADRPSTNMGFTMSPALAAISSVSMSHIYAETTTCTTLITSPSGLGYIYPELLSSRDLGTYARETTESMARTQMKILNILAGNDNVSDETLQRSSGPFLRSESVDAVFYYTYGSGYAGGSGKALRDETTGKPVITARFSLWEEGSDPSSPMLGNDAMIAALMEQVKDSSTAQGYSLIPVHAWSHTTADVAYIVEQLALKDPGVDVVTPAVFLNRFNERVVDV